LWYHLYFLLMQHLSTLKETKIINQIYIIRGHNVMLDFDLAHLYGVETRVLNQAVKRQIGRFPPDFMFQLSAEEFSILKSLFVTSGLEVGQYDRIFRKKKNSFNNWCQNVTTS
jgi:hypothetical protein